VKSKNLSPVNFNAPLSLRPRPANYPRHLDLTIGNAKRISIHKLHMMPRKILNGPNSVETYIAIWIGIVKIDMDRGFDFALRAHHFVL